MRTRERETNDIPKQNICAYFRMLWLLFMVRIFLGFPLGKDNAT